MAGGSRSRVIANGCCARARTRTRTTVPSAARS